MRAILIALAILAFTTLRVSAAAPIWQNLTSDAYQSVDDYLVPGKWLVVMFWAHDCKICESEIGGYQRFHQRQDGKDVVMLGVTLDGEGFKKQALDFVSRHKVEFNNLIGEPEAVAGFYQIITGSPWVGTPSFLIFGPDGELKAKQAGAVEVEIVENYIANNS